MERRELMLEVRLALLTLEERWRQVAEHCSCNSGRENLMGEFRGNNQRDCYCMILMSSVAAGFPGTQQHVQSDVLVHWMQF